jgi:hypothetical protein
VSTDAWASGFVVVTALLAGTVIEAAAVCHRRRDARRRRTDVEPIPWKEMEHYR